MRGMMRLDDLNILATRTSFVLEEPVEVNNKTTRRA